MSWEYEYEVVFSIVCFVIKWRQCVVVEGEIGCEVDVDVEMEMGVI